MLISINALMWVGKKKLMEWCFRTPFAQEEVQRIMDSLICAEMEKSLSSSGLKWSGSFQWPCSVGWQPDSTSVI